MLNTRELLEILGLAVVVLYTASIFYFRWRRKQDRKAAKQEEGCDLGVMVDSGEDLVATAHQASARKKRGKGPAGRIEDSG